MKYFRYEIDFELNGYDVEPWNMRPATYELHFDSLIECVAYTEKIIFERQREERS